MQWIQQQICSLLGSTRTSSSPVIGKSLQKRMVSTGSKPRIGNVLKEADPVNDFFWDLFRCDTLTPPINGLCIDNSDCTPGEACKQGECITDPMHCVNAGCPDEHYHCNETTGKCDPVPECNNNSQCDAIDAGEFCIDNVCKQPSYCIPGSCPPTWACISNKCIKESCSPVTPSNTDVCCLDNIPFSLNKAACCEYNPSDPRC